LTLTTKAFPSMAILIF